MVLIWLKIKKIQHFETIYDDLIDTTGCGDIFYVNFYHLQIRL